MLKELVLSIAKCDYDRSSIADVIINIVDNDILLSASQVVNNLKCELKDTVKINYYSYPVKGLSNVRNELLRKAFEFDPEFIVFVDDDEKVSSGWLNSLVKTIVQNHGDMAMGPVISAHGDTGSKHISCWVDRPNFTNNTKMNFIRTGNLIINAKSLKAKDIWFDPRFNYTGGEDSFFGVEMIKKGSNIYWASDAVVYETVPQDRANLKWLLKRYYNGANIYSRILKIQKKYFKSIKKTLVSLFYIASGICTAILVLLPFRRRYWGLLKLAEGIGSIAGFFSIKYNEYK